MITTVTAKHPAAARGIVGVEWSELGGDLRRAESSSGELGRVVTGNQGSRIERAGGVCRDSDDSACRYIGDAQLAPMITDPVGSLTVSLPVPTMLSVPMVV